MSFRVQQINSLSHQLPGIRGQESSPQTLQCSLFVPGPDISIPSLSRHLLPYITAQTLDQRDYSGNSQRNQFPFKCGNYLHFQYDFKNRSLHKAI